MKIVYFSHTGNCEKMANLLRAYTFEKPLEIKPIEPYPTDYEDFAKLAKKQIEDGKNITLEKMELRGNEEIYLIFPSWHRRLPQPVVSFINVYKPSRIIAIVSSYEGELGNCDMVMKGLCKDFKMIGVKQGNEKNVIKVLYARGLLE